MFIIRNQARFISIFVQIAHFSELTKNPLFSGNLCIFQRSVFRFLRFYDRFYRYFDEILFLRF